MKRSKEPLPKVGEEEPFFDHDLEKIFVRRLALRIKTIFKTLIHHGIELGDEEFEEFFKFVKSSASSEIKEETERYRKKTKNRKYGLKKDIERARMGNNASLFRLVEWDKGWLFVDWVKNKILEAQENWDNDFLQKIGEALSAEPRVRIPIDARDKEERKLILTTIEALIPYFTMKNPDLPKAEIVNMVIRTVFDNFEEKWDHWLSKDAEDDHFSNDLGYFRQYVKRHLTID